MDNFNTKWGFDPAEIDILVLSHAHIDHSGRIPKLVKDGFDGEIYCTSATRDLSAIMLLDSAMIQEREAEYRNRRNAQSNKPFEKPLYTAKDATRCLDQFVSIGYERWHKMKRGISVLFRDSGHILGSASVTLKIEKADRSFVYFGFTADIGRPHRPILRDPVPMPDVDYLICESTYGGIIHEKESEDLESLLRIIKETCVENRGKLLIPAFSVGRTQEVVFMLDQLENSGRLPKIKVFVDSPMAVNATEIFIMHPECFDDEINKYMIHDPNPFGFNGLTYIREVEASKALNNFKDPCIIISASGMMNAGRIKNHLSNHLEDPTTTVLVVGYCADGTLGSRIRNGENPVRIFGQEVRVNARIEIMDSFSAHGDEPEMLDYLKHLDKTKLKKLFLVHGEPEKQELFREALRSKGFKNVEIPGLYQEVELG
jgi:metallo-beta-lactamase family protein